MASGSLFPPWEPPPQFAPPPADGGLVQRVHKLAEFVQRNGSQFQDLMRQKQRDNPEYAFLFGGDGAVFYRWILYCKLNNMSPDVPPAHPNTPQASQPLQQPPPEADWRVLAAAAPPEVQSEFTGILENLNGTKDAIKAAQRWFLQQHVHAPSLAAAMVVRSQLQTEYQAVLHIIYLINDILVHSLQSASTQPELLSTVKAAFSTSVSTVMAVALANADNKDEAKERLCKIARLWVDRGIYQADEVADMEARAFNNPQASGTAPTCHIPQAPGGPMPPPQPDPMHPPPAPWQVSSAPGMAGPPPGQYGYPPAQGMAPPQAAPWAPHPHQPPPADPMHGARPPWSGPQPGGPAPMHIPPQYSGMPQPHQPPPANPGAPIGHMGGPVPMPWGPPAPGPGFAPGPPGPHMQQGHMPPPHEQMPPAHPPPPFAPPDEPPPAPVNTMCFPPGILPHLLSNPDRDERSYKPLTVDEIQNEGLPPPKEPDAYLQSRIDKFYTEVSGYHGSKTRAEILVDRGQDARGMLASSRSEPSSRPGSGPLMDPDPDTGMLPDGSFVKKGGDRSARGGLGSHTANEAPADDPYSMYRAQRSGVYHAGRGGSAVAARSGR